jgi:shikimate dehydrogenase
MAAAGASSVTLRNRTVERAESAAGALRRAFPQTRFETAPLSAPGASADLVVNCTSGAAAAHVRSLDASGLRRDAIWCDINYWMEDPPQVAVLAARGVRVQTGMPMLLHQAALAFEHFTGIRPEIRTLGGDNNDPGI